MTESSPTILGFVELPSSNDVVAHNGRIVRFRGWVASTSGRQTAARYRIGRRPWTKVRADVTRPDVVDIIGSEHGIEDPRIGFDFYVDLPRRSTSTTIDFALTDGKVATPTTRYRICRPDPLRLETYEGDSEAKRELAARYLEGRGVELGALHLPLKIDGSKAEVRYADRLTKPEAIATFPELEEHYGDQIVEPDFIVDLDVGDLGVLAGEDLDFFIANDVIEHLANPLRFLESIHDIMRPGARLFLSAPDRRFTFDVHRHAPSHQHLLDEYDRHVTVVDDDHIREFVEVSDGASVPDDPEERERLFGWHRSRSVHVHAWDQREFDKMLTFARRRLGLRFRVLARLDSYDACGCMVYVLEKD